MLDYQFLKSNIFNLVNVDAKKVLDSIQEDEAVKNEEGGPKKRKRLEDFTPQERMIRRKLKNRAAAQSARDRKKERMDQLELVVGKLEVENKELKRSNEELRTNMHALMTQNQELLQHLRNKEQNKDTATPETTTSTTDEIKPTGTKRRVTEFYTDHTYYARIEKLEPDHEEVVVATTPSNVEDDDVVVVVGDDHVVIKKEEETGNTKHAAEIADSSCFLNHDVVNQSQIDQLLNIYEHGGPGQSSQANDLTESRAEIETEELKSNSGTASDGSGADITGVRTEEEAELFELCQEIQNIVRETDTDSLTEDNLDKICINVDEKCYETETMNSNTKDVPTTEPLIEGELNMVDYNDEETNCVILPDDLLESSNHHYSVPLADELLDSIVADKGIHDGTSCSNSNGYTETVDDDMHCSISNDYTDLFSLKDFDSLLDSYHHPVVTDQPLHSTNSSNSSSHSCSVDVGEEWNDLLTDLFPSLA